MKKLLTALLLGALLSPLAAQAEKTDVIVLNNGDRITGEIKSLEAGFLEILDLDMSLGFDYSKSTDISNFNLSSDFRYATADRKTEASLRSDLTRQSQGDDQTRNVLEGTHEYLLPERRFRNWSARFENNEALGVDYRLTFSGNFGKYLVKTNNKWFTLSAGLAATQEQPAEGESETNIEIVGTARYRYFRFATPERSLDTTLSIFPSVTDSGRWRGDLRTTFKLELVEDLFWAMELYATYDSDPLSLSASTEKEDYGIITSFGWSY